VWLHPSSLKIDDTSLMDGCKMADEFSKYRVKFEFESGYSVEGILDRLKSPITVNNLVNKLPIIERIAPWPPSDPVGICFKANLGLGREKVVRNVQSGDIGYWPLGDSICLFFKDSQLRYDINPLGRITKGIEYLTQLKRGEKVVFSLI